MHTLVVHESMYGNTRAVAEAIAQGMQAEHPADRVDVVPAGEATDADLVDVDLLVAGGPTHAWGLSRERTRQAAVDAATSGKGTPPAEPGADGPGLREWLGTLPAITCSVAAFDTRRPALFGLSGSAARPLARCLTDRGGRLLAAPQHFGVTGRNRLVEGELARARDWGSVLAAAGHAAESRPSR